MKRSGIEPLLPEVFRRALRPGTPLGALLDVMEDLHEPAEQVIGRIETFFDPHATPEAFLPTLARWVDLDRFFRRPAPGAGESPDRFSLGATAPGHLRELIVAAALLSQWRGTARGLRLFLETATGLTGYQFDEQVPWPEGTPGAGTPRAFHLRITAPPAAHVHRALIARIIDQEKPAYVTYEVQFGPEGRGENS